MKTMLCVMCMSIALSSECQTNVAFTNSNGRIYFVELTAGDYLNDNSPTNLTFTDLNGRSYSNAVVTATNPASITIRWGGASEAQVYFTNAPDNIRFMFHYDATNSADFLAKEERQKNDRAVGYMLSSFSAKIEKERQDKIDRVKATAHDVVGEVFQVLPGGALVNLYSGLNEVGAEAFMDGRIKSSDSWDKTLVFLTNYGSLLVDGEHLRMTTYPIGNYTYDSVNGSGKTVLRITTSLETALEWDTQLHPQITSTSEPIGLMFKQEMKEGIPVDIYNGIEAKAERDWPDDYEMQAYEIKKQVESYKQLHQ